MVEFAWSGGELFYRERSFQVDASGSFCGVTEFGDWKKVPTLHEFPPQEPSNVDAKAAGRYVNAADHDFRQQVLGR